MAEQNDAQRRQPRVEAWNEHFTTFGWILAIVLILIGLWLLTEVLAFLAILFIAAVVGVFPVIYLAYRRNRQEVQIERLKKEFDLLGLVDSDEKYKVAGLYNQVYGPGQFWLYIGLIMILSVAVLVAFGSQLTPKLAQVLGGLPSVPASLAPSPAASSVVTTTQIVTSTVSLPVTATVSTAVTTTEIVSTTVSTAVTTTEILSTTEVVTTTVSTPMTTSVSTPGSTTQIVTTTARSKASEPPDEPPQTNNLITLMFIGFLGAYVYSIQELVRRYNTFDLQPQVYASILVRMLVAIILIYVGSSALVAVGGSAAPPAASGASDLSAGITAIWAPAIVAFIIGAFPSRGIQWFGRISDRVLGPEPDAASTLPIMNLLGVSTWHASRLEQIGIDDAQNLAHADISKLLLTTPFDPQVIVNWIDQSMLYVKVGSRITNFRDAGITTFTALKASLNDKSAEDLKNLAAALLGTNGNAAALNRLGDPSVFPNYGHIDEYYRRIPTVAQQWAAEGMRELVATMVLQQFENMEQLNDYIKREQSTLSPDASAERHHLLGIAYVERARRLEGDDTDEAKKARKADLERGQKCFNAAVGKDKSAAEAWYLLSSCLFLLGESEVDTTKQKDYLQEAVRAATSAIRARRSYDLAYLSRAGAYAKLENNDRSLSDLDEALRLNDRLATAYFERAARYAVKGDLAAGNASEAWGYYTKAKADYKQAYYCGYGNEGGVRLGIGETAYKLGKNAGAVGEIAAKPQLQAEALDALSRAMELLDGKDLAKARLWRGMLYQDMKQDGDAKEDLKAAVTLDASNLVAGYEYATLLARLDYERIIKAEPNNIPARYGYATLLARLGDLPAAKAEYERIIAADPDMKSEEAKRSYLGLQLLPSLSS